MSIRAGVVVAITFQQVNNAPDAKASANGDHEGLKNRDCRCKKCHMVDSSVSEKAAIVGSLQFGVICPFLQERFLVLGGIADVHFKRSVFLLQPEFQLA